MVQGCTRRYASGRHVSCFTGTAPMFDLLYQTFDALLVTLSTNLLKVLAYPINPAERVFVLYLTTSLLMAAGVWRYVARRTQPDGSRISFREFLFPRSIWRTASAWLDVRYFFFHQVFRVFLYGTFALMVSEWAFQTTAGLLGSPSGSKTGADGPLGWLIALGYGFASVVVMDLVAYTLHYCQHRFPLLWEFHKVHHSARVMHPLTNYREHPVDNVLYAGGLGAATGVVTASVSALLGYVPSAPTVLGVEIFMLAYNGLGYNLRHSHIWLKWPGPLAYLFGSPAHHQVHHSYHPTHINKNFAFMFPFWDVVFGTYHMPATNADVKFGLSEREEEEFTSCLELYLLPFRNVARSFMPMRSRMTADEQVVRPETS